jgi:hypothetical protein
VSWLDSSFVDTIFIFILLTPGGKVNAKFTLEQAMKAQRGSRGIALFFL